MWTKKEYASPNCPWAFSIVSNKTEVPFHFLTFYILVIFPRADNCQMMFQLSHDRNQSQIKFQIGTATALEGGLSSPLLSRRDGYESPHTLSLRCLNLLTTSVSVSLHCRYVACSGSSSFSISHKTTIIRIMKQDIRDSILDNR